MVSLTTRDLQCRGFAQFACSSLSQLPRWYLGLFLIRSESLLLCLEILLKQKFFEQKHRESRQSSLCQSASIPISLFTRMRTQDFTLALWASIMTAFCMSLFKHFCTLLVPSYPCQGNEPAIHRSEIRQQDAELLLLALYRAASDLSRTRLKIFSSPGLEKISYTSDSH